MLVTERRRRNHPGAIIPLPMRTDLCPQAGRSINQIRPSNWGNMSTVSKPDRYTSFEGIESDSNSRMLIAMLMQHISDPEKTNRFWEQFKSRLELIGRQEENNGRCLDELFLIHCNINNIRELFEEYDDQPALNLLEQIELESC